MKSLSLSQPHLLIVVGIPGSGKSLFAERFAATFHAPYVHYDAILELSNQNGTVGGRYTVHLLQELFKTRQTVVFDGPAESRAQRQELQDIAADAGYRPLFIWVQTDEATSKARFLKAGKQARRRVSPAMFDSLLREFDLPTAKESPVVISGKHTYATQAKAVLKHLVASRQIIRPTKPRERPAGSGQKRNASVS